ncbi:MAG: LysR family transcriptional regulator, partial [Polaromonas sp.]
MVFDGVFKTSSVSRAAEQLGMTQAAATTALNKLRVHFNDPLFSRTARGMLP